MIKLLIFDLDNTLFDTYSQIGAKVLEPMIEEMRLAGLTKDQELQLRKRYSYTGFRIISKQLKLNSRVVKIGMHAYKFMDLSKIKPYPDIRIIPAFSQEKILVTSGVSKVQQSKVDILKIRKYFKEVIIDESSSIDNKRKIFRQILKKYSLNPTDVMVIGDNPESEIAAGTALGMVTVQIIRRHGMLKGNADYHIKGLKELKKILSPH